MIYIKLNDDRDLVITVSGSLYRGDNLNQKVVFLIPSEIDEIDTAAATIYLTYIRADGVADIEALECDEEMYNSTYYQYRFPVTSKLTKCAGSACVWLQIVTGTLADMVIAKSGECILQIQDSKNLDDYVCDHQLTAIYELQQTIAELTATDSDSDGDGNSDGDSDEDGDSTDDGGSSSGDDSGDDSSGDDSSGDDSSGDDDDDDSTFIDF